MWDQCERFNAEVKRNHIYRIFLDDVNARVAIPWRVKLHLQRPLKFFKMLFNHSSLLEVKSMKDNSLTLHCYLSMISCTFKVKDIMHVSRGTIFTAQEYYSTLPKDTLLSHSLLTPTLRNNKEPLSQLLPLLNFYFLFPKNTHSDSTFSKDGCLPSISHVGR